MVAMEAKYHAKCLVSLYNRARPLRTGTCKAVEHSGPNLDELAFAELITYIEERLDSEDLALLKMAELTIIFRTKLESSNQACLLCLTAFYVNMAQLHEIATQEPKNAQCPYTRR